MVNDVLKIEIIGDAVSGGKGSAASVAGGGTASKKSQDAEKAMRKIANGGLAAGIGAAVGMALGGPAGAAIGKLIGDFIFVAIGASIGMILGPLGGMIGVAVGLGVKKALDNSEAVQGLKKLTKKGLGAIVDSIVGLGYLLVQQLGLNNIIDFALDPVGWISDKIGLSDLFDDMSDWFEDEIMTPALTWLEDNGIDTGDLFDFSDASEWFDTNVIGNITKWLDNNGLTADDLFDFGKMSMFFYEKVGLPLIESFNSIIDILPSSIKKLLGVENIVWDNIQPVPEIPIILTPYIKKPTNIDEMVQLLKREFDAGYIGTDEGFLTEALERILADVLEKTGGFEDFLENLQQQWNDNSAG